VRPLLVWAARPPTRGAGPATSFSSSSAAVLNGTPGSDSTDVGEDAEGEYAASPVCVLGGVDIAEAEGSRKESFVWSNREG
jgi:hypothetical protein